MTIMKYINTKEVAELFATSKQLVSHHIANILKKKELNKSSVVKQYLTTAADGKNYNVVFDSLEKVPAFFLLFLSLFHDLKQSKPTFAPEIEC